MTITTKYSPQQYIGNGVTTVFAIPFEFFETTSIIVQRTVISTGVTTDITGSSVVTGGDGSTGSVTITPAPTSDHRITISLEEPYEQNQVYVQDTVFLAENIERGYDLGVVLGRQAKEASERALSYGVTTTTTSNRVAEPVDGATLIYDGVTGDLGVGPTVTNIEDAASNAAAAVAAASASEDARDLSQDWATLLNSLVDSTDHSSKEYAIGTTAASAKRWAEEAEDTEVDTGQFSAKHHALKAAASAVQASLIVPHVDTVDPTVNDDSDAGYEVGKRWINTSTNEAFILLNATVGAAVWEQITVDSSDLGALALLNTVDTAQIDNDAITLDKIAAAVYASQAEAEAGTENTKLMTALRTKQAIDELAGRPLLHVQDQKTSGTDGGGNSGSTWNTRTLNTVLTNEISGASLLSNQITLPAGTYYVEGTSPAFNINSHKLRLRNITDGVTELLGTSEYTRDIASPPSQTRSVVCGRFTLGGSKTLEIQHYTSVAGITNSFGVSMASGEAEVFSDIKIWKVS